MYPELSSGITILFVFLVYSVNWAKQNGIPYQKEACIVVGKTEDNLRLII